MKERLSCDSGSDNTIQKLTRKPRKYLKDWETIFKWVKQDSATKRPFCIFCKQLLMSQKNHLERHQNTQKHIDRIQNSLDCEEMLVKHIPTKKGKSRTEEQSSDQEDLLTQSINVSPQFECVKTEDIFVPSPTPNKGKKRLRPKTDESTESPVVRDLAAFLMKQNSPPKYSNDVEAFGEYVKAVMSNISSEELRDQTMFEFNNILFETKKKQRLLNSQSSPRNSE